jgi:tRNA 5-methylaminomethyl-2-thiouridine biosynthesis bifunctional protein
MKPAQLAGWPVAIGGWWFPGGGWVDPGFAVPGQPGAPRCGDPSALRLPGRASSATLTRWRALDGSGGVIAEAPVLILANASRRQTLRRGRAPAPARRARPGLASARGGRFAT